MSKIDIRRVKETRDILQDAKTLVNKLDMVAAYDDVFDKDEVQLIDVITKNIHGYSELLENVLEDGIVDEKEINKMQQYEETLTKKIKTQVRMDGNISDSEQDILNVLFDCLSNLQSFK